MENLFVLKFVIANIHNLHYLFNNVLEPFANANGCAIPKIVFHFYDHKNIAIVFKSDSRFRFVESSLMFIFESKIHTKKKLLG